MWVSVMEMSKAVEEVMTSSNQNKFDAKSCELDALSSRKMWTNNIDKPGIKRKISSNSRVPVTNNWALK